MREQHETKDKTKVIFVNPPRKIMWRGWLKPKEAREYAGGIDKRTWRKWKKQGLKTVKVNGLMLTRPEWMDDFIMEAGVGDLREEAKNFLVGLSVKKQGLAKNE